MEVLGVEKKHETETTWEFIVEVEDHGDTIGFSVEVDKSYWKELSKSKQSPEDLVKRSFIFLTKKEPLGSILRQFNLREIQKHFPDYEDTMKGRRGLFGMFK